MPRMPCLMAAAALLAGALLGGGAALAQEEVSAPPVPAAPVELSGTLAKLHRSGQIVLGHRESSVPFSYRGPRGEPIGYSVELCKALVRSIEEALHRPLAVQWVHVSADNRIEAVTGGRVDLECGSTTANLERRQQVAFSPVIFVAGTRLMVRKGSPVRDFRDLAGRKVAVTAGTTNEKALRTLAQKFGLAMQIVVVGDHAQGFAQVAEGQADAFATDDVLLYGLIAEKTGKSAGRNDRFAVVGDFLSYDPYGIMFRKDDPQLAQVVDDGLRALAQDGEIERQYTRWFLRKLPSGSRLDLPMSPQLETIIQTLAVRTQ